MKAPINPLDTLGKKLSDYTWMYNNLSNPKITLDALCSQYGKHGDEMYAELERMQGKRQEIENQD